MGLNSRFSCCYLPASMLVLNCSLFGRPGFPCPLVGSDHLGSIITQQKMGLEGSQFRSDHNGFIYWGSKKMEHIQNRVWKISSTLHSSEFRKRSVLFHVCTQRFSSCKSERGPIKNPPRGDWIVLDIPSEVGIHLVFWRVSSTLRDLSIFICIRRLNVPNLHVYLNINLSDSR